MTARVASRKAKVTVAGAAGRVTSVEVNGPAQSCVTKEVSKAKFPKFSNSSFSFTYPFKLLIPRGSAHRGETERRPSARWALGLSLWEAGLVERPGDALPRLWPASLRLATQT